MARRLGDPGQLDPEVMWIFMQMTLYMTEGYVTFAPTHEHRPDELPRDGELFAAIQRHLPAIQAELGWVSPTA